MLALLLLLAATMVSTVILTAVASVSKRIKNDRETQQEYLNVSSAAELLRASIMSSEYKRVEVTRFHRAEADQAWSSTYDDHSVIVTEADEMGLMGKWISSCIDDDGELVGFFDDSIKIDVEDFSTVHASFALKKGESSSTDGGSTAMDKFDILIILSGSGTDGNSEDIDDCRITLRVMGTLKKISGYSESDNHLEKEETKNTTIEWETTEITKGG